MGKCVVHPITDSSVRPQLQQLQTHLADSTKHITAAERSLWNQKPYQCGVYTGNGASSQEIYLGFQPSFVAVWDQWGLQASPGYAKMGGVALPNRPCGIAASTALLVTSVGFRVYFDSAQYIRTNDNGTVFYYIVFR